MNRPAKTTKPFTACALFLLLATAVSPNPQLEPATDLEKSCRIFVQSFYDWYVPKALDINETHAIDEALRSKVFSFTPELAKLLKEDTEAEAKHPGEIVGLDFDPFLSSQDPSERFLVANIIRKGGTYFVEVNGISSAGKREKVIAELTRKKDQWLFANFHYPKFEQTGSKNADLISILKHLREAREAHAK
jgi:Protein of unknown function (DUF3828)